MTDGSPEHGGWRLQSRKLRSWGPCVLVICILFADIIGIATGHEPPHLIDANIVIGVGIVVGILLRLAFGLNRFRKQ
jgi:hypothetical protein